MKKYGSGKAGQYAKNEAQQRFDGILFRIFLAVSVSALFVGITLGYQVFPLVFQYLAWARRIPATAYWAVAIALEALAVAVFISFKRALRGPLDRLSEERIRYLHGGETEALVAYSLQSLSDEWHLFNGIAMKGGGDIDHVLVGPGGLFCLSTKGARGTYARGPDGRVTLNGKPTDDVNEAQRLAMKLRNWLEARLNPDHTVKSIPFVQPVLVVPFAFVDFPFSTLNTWVLAPEKLFSLADEGKTKLNPATIVGCVNVLQDLTGWQEHSGRVRVTPAVTSE